MTTTTATRPKVKSDTWLWKQARRAGFKSDAELARASGVPYPAIANCTKPRGAAPAHLCWGYIVALAPLLEIEPDVLVAKLWDEKVGDPCPCGCGGRKALPSDCECDRPHDRMRRLAYRIPCRDCGVERFHHRNESTANHRDACLACAGRRRASEPVVFSCVGFPVFEGTQHAQRCEGDRALLPWEIRQIQKAHTPEARDELRARFNGGQTPKKTSKVLAFIDVESHTRRCGKCAAGIRCSECESHGCEFRRQNPSDRSGRLRRLRSSTRPALVTTCSP